jgi:hypothetical protein
MCEGSREHKHSLIHLGATTGAFYNMSIETISQHILKNKTKLTKATSAMYSYSRMEP